MQSLGKSVSQEAIDNFHLTVGSDEFKVRGDGEPTARVNSGLPVLRQRSIKVNFALVPRDLRYKEAI